MGMARKAMASGLLTLLLLLNSGLAPAVLGSSDDDCWVDDHVHYVVCLKTEKCRSSCVEHGSVDGRCQWGFPNLLPFCQCLRPNCPPEATGASG
ncbi:hypothetical protein SETIT_3G208800v2 [Setaria italica]|uniref:Knottin scorpion toxin-like domain-containing protein n=2 Tax=Setaria TaxID=4554 RepID=K3ZE19_SETIT|nr:hypothetical protein SETIT_3G208800v2 [Setaria italica]TKW26786.1 hypothetical protein SEVIR_3G214100v2 [Setaria viridis]